MVLTTQMASFATKPPLQTTEAHAAYTTTLAMRVEAVSRPGPAWHIAKVALMALGSRRMPQHVSNRYVLQRFPTQLL